MSPRKSNAPDLSEQLRQAILSYGLSLSKLAEETGVHKAQLSRFLRQEQSLTLKAASKVCTYLGLSLVGSAPQPKE